MKNKLLALIIFSLPVLTPVLVKAQAWEKDTKVLSLGIGASQFFNGGDYYLLDRRVPGYWYWPVTGQINFQGEFGVHKYVGIGFTTGIGGRGGLGPAFASELNIPIGLIANFHFYQLIADKTGRHIFADKLDIYAGVNLGSGVAFVYNIDPTRIVPIGFGGLHVGVRYYFTDKVGVNGELGWGKSIVNAGLVFKI